MKRKTLKNKYKKGSKSLEIFEDWVICSNSNMGWKRCPIKTPTILIECIERWWKKEA